MHLYDTIGHGYRGVRRPDPRIAEQIRQALDAAATVLNVGAGAGSYEPGDREVVAVEPSATMIRQRAVGSAPVVRATGPELPFADGSFDATLAILTLHHWQDRARGLAELARVARRWVVILTWDPAAPGFWLDRYFPEILAIDRGIFPALDELQAILGSLHVAPVPIPHDCTDGFLGSYWRRPEAYLDARVRSAISTFARIRRLEPGLTRLEADLASGAWQRRHAELSERGELDLGYRLVVAGSPSGG